jgi:hypothetical protein
MDSTKSLVDQIREIEKLISDGTAMLAQAQFALHLLQQRIENERSSDGDDQPTRAGASRSSWSPPSAMGIQSGGWTER